MSKKKNQHYKEGHWLTPKDFFETQHQQYSKEEKMHGKVYMIPLPLVKDHLMHIPPAVLETIPRLNTFFVENIRTARRFISSLRLDIDIRVLNFYTLNQKTDRKTIAQYLEILKKEKEVGIMSECGLPSIADPGATFIEKAQRHDIKIIPLTGPSSIFLALMGSGLNGQKFHFNGYLPIQTDARRKEILRYVSLCKKSKATQIFIETPYRNKGLLHDLLEKLPDDMLLTIATELTGERQSIITKKVKYWKKDCYDIPKSPAIFLFNY